VPAEKSTENTQNCAAGIGRACCARPRRSEEIGLGCNCAARLRIPAVQFWLFSAQFSVPRGTLGSITHSPLLQPTIYCGATLVMSCNKPVFFGETVQLETNLIINANRMNTNAYFSKMRHERSKIGALLSSYGYSI
jgi:hypothetical protein